jgi:hypothetical protein
VWKWIENYNKGVKMSYFSKKNIYNIIDYLMERIHETTPNIYIYIYIYIYITEKLWIIAIIFLSPVSYLPQILSNWWESGYIISLNKFWIVLFFFLGAILQKKKKTPKKIIYFLVYQSRLF